MKIGFVGDICPTKINEPFKITEEILNEFHESTIISILRQNDFNVANLECPITQADTPINKIGPSLKCDSNSIEILKSANISIASLANNHIKDFGKKGIEDTINLCKQNGIMTSGAGIQKQDSEKPIIVSKKNINVGIISIAENEFNAWDAEHGGTNSFSIINIYNQIITLKEKVDHIIVFAHGGNEHFHYPSPEIRKTYRFFTKLGVSAVIGHHPHCMQGYEVYNNTPIFYSLGNFFFPSSRGFEESHYGFIVNLIFTQNSCDYEILSYKQCLENYKVDLFVGEEKHKRLKFIKKISDVIHEEKLLVEKWEQFLKMKQETYLRSLIPINKYLFAILKKLGLLSVFLTKNFILTILNNIRCETRRENLIFSLNKKLLK